MKARVVVIIALFIILPYSVQAFELTYQGQKDFWSSFNKIMLEDIVTGEKITEEYWDFGHSIELNFSGQDDLGYIRGYISDHPQLMDQTYIDFAYNNIQLQWDNYEQAFMIPSWFNLEQKFRGLRFNYIGEKDWVNLLGLKGENILRIEDLIISSEEESVGISLKYYPIVSNSIRVWIDGAELQYGIDFVVDPIRAILFLQYPIRETSHLHVEYLEEGQGYLVLGGRYDHDFQLGNLGENLTGGLLFFQSRDDKMSHNFLGTEWMYQVKPWWSMEFNAGLMENHNLNWRLAQYFNWRGLNVNIDYQVIEDNFQNLFFDGQEGKKLQLFTRYEGGNIYLKHQQDYHWTMDGQILEQSEELELIGVISDWVPYVFYSLYEREDLVSHHGIVEIGYQTKFAKEMESLTYQLGVDVKSSSEVEKWYEDAEPYFGILYKSGVNRNIGAKLYGEEGFEFAQFMLIGNWDYEAFNWDGQLSFLPDYYRLNNELIWSEFPVDIRMDWIQKDYFTINQEYLSLDLNLDWTAWLEEDVQFWLSLQREKNDIITTSTYLIGGEKELLRTQYLQLVGYGEMNWSGMEREYTGGIRGARKWLQYDLNYTRSRQYDEAEMSFNDEMIMPLIRKDKIGFSLGVMDYWNMDGELEVDVNKNWMGSLNLRYPIMPALDLKLGYEGMNRPWISHKFTTELSYYF